MNELSTYQENLPATIEELSKFVLVGREKLTAVKAEIRAIDKVNLAREVRDQKRDEARMLSEALLDAEVKLGEMLKEIPKVQGRRTDLKLSDTAVAKSKTTDTAVESFGELKPKHEVIAELGFYPKQAERFETLANNKDLVEQVKAEARENDDLPTRTQVLNLAKARSEKFKQEYQQIDDDYKNFQQFNRMFRELDAFTVNHDFLDSVLRTSTLVKAEANKLDCSDGFENQLKYMDRRLSKLNEIRSYFYLMKAKGGVHGKE